MSLNSPATGWLSLPLKDGQTTWRIRASAVESYHLVPDTGLLKVATCGGGMAHVMATIEEMDEAMAETDRRIRRSLGQVVPS